MPSFTCRELGMNCSFTVTGTTEKELMKNFVEHAERTHKMKVLDADILYKVRKAIKK
jgi:predicted small metal-binding protein